MSDLDDYFDDEIDAAAFDAAVTAATSFPSTNNPVASGSGNNIFTQKRYIQPTIFGASQVPPKPSRQNNISRSQYQPPVPKSTQQQPKVKAVKKWDRLSAIKILPDVIKSSKKNKKERRAGDQDEDEENDDDDNDDDLDSDTDLLLKALENQDVSTQQEIPMKLQSDPEAVRNWIYSINKPKRKYQYDIVARALFNNCLVSLPTGLGKTFIAAVVMLNFYRWYPKGKVIFLAPTRPLVHQQIEACHSIAGIPSIDCASLTGTTSAAKRANAWVQKRVIFATPQTVANDLRRGTLRPEDVICVVVDEAHRATGAYAYCVVVRLLMRFNPHFRVLALTATPGSDPERVQCVIDNLHIGHIEVRTEESMDIKPYTRNKEIVLEKIPLTAELMSIRDQWGKLMLPLIKQCGSLFHGPKEPAYIHAFSITSAQMNIPKERTYLRPNLSVLSKMATVMGKLLEYSIPLAYEKMKELKNEPNKCARGVCSQVGYKSLMEEIEQLTKSPGFVPHPKMEKMKALTIDFFINAQDCGKSSRVMIFCHFRDMVTDIVSYLNQERPLIKASPFIGQSNDVRGNRGMNQKTQNSVIQQFKNDEFNVLVATSIGEEGLDIGALDLIICYEAQKSPLRMLQRLGRTGRNEDGKVIVLIAEGREDKNWEKAQDQYQHVQNALLSKKVLELYEDCERLIPEGVRPTPIDEMIDVQPYIAEQVEIDLAASKSKKDKAGTKRKRPGVQDIPAGAMLGFVNAKDYKVPRSKAEALRERAEGALLSVEEAAILKEQWSRNTTSDNIQPPIDPNNMDIAYFPTKSPLGSKLAAVPSKMRLGRNMTRSYKHSLIIKQSEEFIADDEKCEAWRRDQMAQWNEKNVILWSSEMRGKGARRPLRLCADGSKSIRRLWHNSHVACTEAESIPNSMTALPKILAPSSSQQEPLSPRCLNELMEVDTQPSQNDLPEANDLIFPRKSLKQSSPSPLIKGGVTKTNGQSLTQSPVNVGLEKSSGSHRLSAFKNTRHEPTPFGPNKSNGFKRLSAFKNLTVEPAPFVPILKPAGTRAASSKLLQTPNQTTHLERKTANHDDDLAGASDSSLEFVPDSESESKPRKLRFSLPGPIQDVTCGISEALPKVDKDASLNASFCHIISDSDGPPKRQSQESDAVKTHLVSESDDQFEELDLEDLNVLDRLEENFNKQNNGPHLQELPSQAPVNEPVLVNEPVPASSNDNFSEFDVEALATLDELENGMVERPITGHESTRRRSPVTPNVLSSYHSFAKESSLTSQLHDHSPLLFRSLGSKSQKSLVNANEDGSGDVFLDPSTIMLGTQMPCNKRISRNLNNGIQQKRIIAELSEEEEDDDNDKVGKVGKSDHSPLKSNLRIKSKGKQKMVSRPRRGNEWAAKTGLFDIEAMESDTSISEEEEEEAGVGQRKKRKKARHGKKKKKRGSSSESIESENSIDRDFLVHTSSNIKDNCSPDKSMTSFYRASILMMSQPLSVVKQKLNHHSKNISVPHINQINNSWKNKSKRLNQNHASTSRHHHHQQEQVKSSDDLHNKFINSNDDNDQFSFDSFCVPDEETIEYEDNMDTTLDTSEI